MYVSSGNNAYKKDFNRPEAGCRNSVVFGECGITHDKSKAKVSPRRETRRLVIHREAAVRIAAAEHAVQKKYARRRFLNYVSVVLIIAAVTFAYIGILNRSGRILEMNYSNVRLEREIKQVNIESGNIREEFVKTVDPSYLRSAAINDLGMREPAQAQKLTVSIPNGDRVILAAEVPETEDDVGLDSKLFENLEGFFKTMR